MKVLSVDYGEKRVGLALGDTETNLALPYGVLERLSDETLIRELEQVIAEEEVERVLVGDPVGARGQTTAQTESVRAFTALLRAQVRVPVELFDERFTSQRADAALSLGGKVRGRDELAAMFLLQDYLDRAKP